MVQLPPLEDWVPAAQFVQCSPQVLPGLEVVLGGHCVQDVAPADAEKVLAGHETQAPLFK